MTWPRPEVSWEPSLGNDSLAVGTGVGQRPPGLVRLERRLGLPVPVQWRALVAESILNDVWVRRRVTRVRWLRAHRIRLFLGIVLFEVAFATALVRAYGFTAEIPPLVGSPLGALLGSRLNKDRVNRRAQSEAMLVSQTQVRALAWNGLEPDGTLTVEPDRWLTLAALPPWAILLIAILELLIVGTAGVLVIGLFAVATAHS